MFVLFVFLVIQIGILCDFCKRNMLRDQKNFGVENGNIFSVVKKKGYEVFCRGVFCFSKVQSKSELRRCEWGSKLFNIIGLRNEYLYRCFLFGYYMIRFFFNELLMLKNQQNLYYNLFYF